MCKYERDSLPATAPAVVQGPPSVAPLHTADCWLASAPLLSSRGPPESSEEKISIFSILLFSTKARRCLLYENRYDVEGLRKSAIIHFRHTYNCHIWSWIYGEDLKNITISNSDSIVVSHYTVHLHLAQSATKSIFLNKRFSSFTTHHFVGRGALFSFKSGTRYATEYVRRLKLELATYLCYFLIPKSRHHLGMNLDSCHLS